MRRPGIAVVTACPCGPAADRIGRAKCGQAGGNGRPAGWGVIIVGSSRSFAIATLVTWLLAESLGLYMLRTWFTSGAARRRKASADGMSLPVLLGHAGLAFTGFICWIAFLMTSSPIVAFVAISALGPAIGLGISTVTVWTPYPVRRGPHERGGRGLADADGGRKPLVISDQALARYLEDETQSGQLIDDLLARNLDPAARPGIKLDPRTLIPLAHGVLAIVTFMLATLAAVAAL
jgi:hypothetical protein